jgi:hypothetical protein
MTLRSLGVFLIGCVVGAVPAAGQSDCGFADCERKILGDNDLEPIANAAGTPEYAFSQGVARLEQQIDAFGICTAARIGETLFMTNYHCARPCEAVQFTMGYEDGLPPEQRRTFKCERLIRKNPFLDYSLFEVARHEGDAEDLAAFPILSLWYGPLAEGQSVILPSHPVGRLMEIDRSAACVLGSVEVFRTPSGRDTIKHMCDSEVGSSGAPLLDRATGYMVGLHWGGRDNEYNMAIPSTLIVDDIRANTEPAVAAELHVVDMPAAQDGKAPGTASP